MTVEIPAQLLASAAGGSAWRAWLGALPQLLRGSARRVVADGRRPSFHGRAAVAVPVRTPDDAAAMLKVGWPHWEAEYEHLALRHWDGRGAVRLLRADPHSHALLLERLHQSDLTSWRIGTVVLEVGAVRTPCNTFQAWLREPGWVRRFAVEGRPGAYLRVVEEGTLQAGDRVEVIETRAPTT